MGKPPTAARRAEATVGNGVQQPQLQPILRCRAGRVCPLYSRPPSAATPLSMTTWHSLWSGMDRDTRLTAALAFWADEEHPEDHAHAIEVLSQHGGFRPQTLLKMPAERKAQRLAATISPTSGLIRDCIRCLYLGPWLRSLSDLLDGLGIEHEQGVLLHEASDIVPPSPEQCEIALGRMAARTPEERLAILVPALHLLYPELYRNLPAAWADLLELAHTPAELVEPETPAPATGTAEAQAPLPEQQPGRFTTFDHQLIQAIVASVTGIEGALDEDGIEDLVDEALHLNVTRHQTYFHRGFLDRLSGREASLDFPEANPDRRAWYLAGAVSALARRQDQAGLVALLDQHEEAFRPLLDGHHPAVVYALPPLVLALWAREREAEIPSLTGPAAFGRLPLPQLRHHLERTTDLLAAQEAERAEPLLVLLEDALAYRVHEGMEVPAWLFHTVARRRAHAMRLRGDFAHAKKRLLEIEKLGPQGIQARVQADLGLIEAGFRSLSRITFPEQRQDLPDLASDLAKGEARFRRSHELAGIDGGHGAYCLAMQAMARGVSAEVLPLAERAVANFAARPRTYRRGGVLARAQLLLGWALAVELESARSAHAAECLEAAVDGLEMEGLYLVEEALGALSQMDPEGAVALAQALLTKFGSRTRPRERVIDAVSQEEVLLRSGEIRQLLLSRAGVAGRCRSERYQDARRLLVAAEQLDDPELAGRALDLMQCIALRNPDKAEADDLLELLESGDAVSTAWDGTEQLEAGIGLLKARGDCTAAAVRLEQLAHRVLGQDSPFAAQEAMDLVPELEALGVEGFPTEELSRRLKASRPDETSDVARGLGRPTFSGRILFLGGNEAQERYQEEVVRRLREEHPRLQVEFRFLGWSSNWGKQLNMMKGTLESADAFVMMRFMRTMCGRELRRIASQRGIPWIACTGHGRESIHQAILRAAQVVGRAATKLNHGGGDHVRV